MNAVHAMVSKGADDWNAGLFYACHGGHLDVVDYVISKGADDWNGGLYYASKCGQADHAAQIQCAKRMISRGADHYDILRYSKDVFLHALYCQHCADHDAARSRQLIRENEPRIHCFSVTTVNRLH